MELYNIKVKVVFRKIVVLCLFVPCQKSYLVHIIAHSSWLHLAPRSMTRAPLNLEALALRQVIKDRGIMNLPSGLVPRMRQELEELARIPGVYEVVDLQISIHIEDEEAEDREYTNNLRLGDKIRISCPTGSSWIVDMVGYDREFSLHQETFTENGGQWWNQWWASGGPTFSMDGFV